jgi:hypothetical protein
MEEGFTTRVIYFRGYPETLKPKGRDGGADFDGYRRDEEECDEGLPRSTSQDHDDEGNQGRREIRATAYVPISQDAKYLRCSGVSLSTFIPIV